MYEGEAKDIVIRESIILLFSVATVIIAARILHGTDILRPVRMRGLLATKRFAQNQADVWQKLANTAATSYHKAHL